MKRILWESDSVFTLDDVKKYRDSFGYTEEDYSDEEVMGILEDNVSLDWDDLKVNLNRPTSNQILVIAKIKLWNTTRNAVKVLDASNLADILSSHSYNAIYYCDNGDVFCDDAHNDGTNVYRFREITCSEKKIGRLCKAIIAGDPNIDELIGSCTKSLYPYISEIFGWED